MSRDDSSLEAMRRRLGPTDELQLCLLMRIPPERRVRTMMSTAAVIMNSLRAGFLKRTLSLTTSSFAA